MGLHIEAIKRSLDVYSIVGKKEAYRAQLLRTTSPDTELPVALEDTYESIEDYIEKSKIDIYNPLMHLVDLIGATNTQKEILRNTIDGILRDKKMIVPYDNPENENCISYKTIEEKVGIRLNIEAITLLVSFANTYLYNKTEDKEHSVIIATHRQPARAFFTYEGNPPKRKDISKKEADKELKREFLDRKKIFVAWRGNSEEYRGEEPERVYERFVDGKLLPSEELKEEFLVAYEKIRHELMNERDIIDEPITGHEKLMDLMNSDKFTSINMRFKFQVLLELRILKGLPSDSKLTEEQKKYVDKFKQDGYDYGIFNKSWIKEVLTPKSLINQDKFIKESGLTPKEHDEKVESFLDKSLSKVSGLKECVDEIIAGFNSGNISNMPIRETLFKSSKKQETLKKRFERILVQAILDGQITDHDYFECMETMHFMLELNNVKLTPNEMLNYVIVSEGGKPTNSPRGKNEKVK